MEQSPWEATSPLPIYAISKLLIVLKSVVGNEMGLLPWCNSRYETAESENTVRERELTAWMLFVSDVRNEMKHSMISLGWKAPHCYLREWMRWWEFCIVPRPKRPVRHTKFSLVLFKRLWVIRYACKNVVCFKNCRLVNKLIIVPLHWTVKGCVVVGTFAKCTFVLMLLGLCLRYLTIY